MRFRTMRISDGLRTVESCASLIFGLEASFAPKPAWFVPALIGIVDIVVNGLPVYFEQGSQTIVRKVLTT
jgi:hypothetical protein